MAKKTVAKKRLKSEDLIIDDINKSFNQNILTTLRLDLKPRNETQKKLTQAIKKNDVTICSGPAGTGKTLITVFEALTLLKTKPEIYREIRIGKSITQLKNEELGTLPGDEKDKLKFHMMSFMDAFFHLIGESKTNKLIEAGIIKFEVFGALRGRSLKNAIIIIDEYQNITNDNSKTFLSRFSDDTKVIVLGDSGQIDIKNKEDSALEPLVNKVKANPEVGVEVVEFSEDDIVRHRLTSYFLNLYKKVETPKAHKTYKAKPAQVDKKLTFSDKFINFFR